jgi:uncharacterized damage-inducible protein DinB
MKATQYYSYSDFLSMYQSARDRIRAFNTIPDDLFTLKPDSKSWSAAEICSHITTFNQLYLKSISRAVDGQPKYTEIVEPSFRPGFMYGLYASSLEPPYKVKLKTLRPLYPAEGEMEKESIINRLIETEESITNQVERFGEQSLDLSLTKGKNPLLRILPMSVTDFLVLMDAHQRRHFWQLEQTLLQLSGKTYRPDD